MQLYRYVKINNKTREMVDQRTNCTEKDIAYITRGYTDNGFYYEKPLSNNIIIVSEEDTEDTSERG